MMKNREFRELQISSTQLAIIFLGILILGVVIFLLGVSVGKKHAQIAQKANVIAQKEPEQVKEKITAPGLKVETEPAKQPAQEKPQLKTEVTPASKEVVPQKPEEKPKVEPTKEEPKAAIKMGAQTAVEKKNLYYVQVAAVADKPAALSTAQKFKNQGYPVVVLDPLPTDKKPVFRIRIGGFLTKEEADEARAKLASASGRKADYFIVRD